MTVLLSPVTGSPLREEGADLLRDSDGRLWPTLDGIPYLRIGRDDLVREAVALIQAGDRTGAIALLLTDQDDWWTGAKPKAATLRDLVEGRDRYTLRAAMDRLGYDRVGTYFAHRWSDPTFLAGMALLEAYWRPTGSSFELACGIGHYGRELARRGVDFTGGDVVFSKLWLARHWVLPASATLVCFDAAAPWPIGPQRFDLVFCHDAFYFLEPKAEILAALRGCMAPAGRLALSHIHNSGADNLSAGRAVSAADMARFFPEGATFDDAELTLALVEARAPRPALLDRLATVEAFSVEDRVGSAEPQSVDTGLAVPPTGASYRLNPLYAEADGGVEVEWPSPRYRDEYGPRATYPGRIGPAEHRRLLADPSADAVRRRVVVDLPERW